MSNEDYRYKDIDEMLTGRLRLAIMAFLMTARESDFVELVEVTEATKGNLGAQIQKLENAGYIAVEKGYLGRRSHMTVSITETGSSAFLTHLSRLNRMIDDKQSH